MSRDLKKLGISTWLTVEWYRQVKQLAPSFIAGKCPSQDLNPEDVDGTQMLPPNTLIILPPDVLTSVQAPDMSMGARNFAVLVSGSRYTL